MLAVLLAWSAAASPALAAPKDEAAAAKEPIPFRRDAEAFDAGTLLRTVLALGVVIAVAVGGIYALKRFLPGSLGGAAGQPGRINVLEIRRVTPRLTLFLIEVDGQRIVLAQSGDRVRPLALNPAGGRDAAG